MGIMLVQWVVMYFFIARQQARLADPEAHKHPASALASSSFIVGMIRGWQYLMFFMCYGVARMVFSAASWKLYPMLTTGVFIGFLAFYALFAVLLADLVVTFLRGHGHAA